MAARMKLILKIVSLSAFAVLPTVALAQTASPLLLVVNTGLGAETVHGSDHSLAVVDPLTNRVLFKVPISGHPHEVAASADGKLAFVTDTSWGRDPGQVSDDSISVIDLVARKELRHIGLGLGSRPHGIVFSGGKAYFASEGFKLIARYDPATDKIDLLLGSGQDRSHAISVSSDSKRIFTPNSDSYSVAVYQAWTPRADYKNFHGDPDPTWGVTIIPTGRGTEGGTLSPDGKEFWGLNRGDDSASIIDTDTLKVKETLHLPIKDPMRIAFTPDGKMALICTAATGEVLVLDTATRKEIKRIKDVGFALHHVLISPDGLHAYVSAKGHRETATPNNVAIIDLKTLEISGYITTGDRAEGLAWAPRQ